MSSSATGSTRADAGDGEGAVPAELERTVERLNQGIVVTYELQAEADDAVAVDLQQSLPPELTVADVGFRTDAAPAEWTVEGDTVHGSGTVPGEETVEYVLGLKLPEAPDELPTFPEPELTDGSDGEDDEAEAERTDNDAEADDEAATDPTAIDLEGAGETDHDDTGDDSTGSEDSTDGPSLVGNTDGALAESVREVIGGSASDEDAGGGDPPTAARAGDPSPTGTTATDGGPEAAGAAAAPEQGPDPRQTPATGDELEAAVAAVEPELEAGEGRSQEEVDESTDEPPELDLSVPEVGDEMAETDTPETEHDAGTPDDESAQEEPARESAMTSDGGTEPAGEPVTDTAAPGGDITGLADRLAAADDADRRAVQEALGLDEVEDDGPSGTVTVRLEKLESRLSAFEAYEDALAEFIDGTGTVEEIEATATEAVEAVDELRTEVAGLRAEVEAAREAVEAAESERAALREDLDALRGDVDEALGLRQQLLGALQNAGGAAGTGATTTDGRARSPDAEE